MSQPPARTRGSYLASYGAVPFEVSLAPCRSGCVLTVRWGIWVWVCIVLGTIWMLAVFYSLILLKPMIRLPISMPPPFFIRLALPPELIRLILALFRSPMALVIDGGVCFADLIRPTSGIRQGCPLSPALFAMLVSPIIQKILKAVPNGTVLLHADDLLIIFHGTPQSCIPAVGVCSEILQDT